MSGNPSSSSASGVARSIRCPRAGCPNPTPANGIVCTGDFTALAGMCRGKKRLGEPDAAMIAGRTGAVAYGCTLCRQWHTGAPAQQADLLVTLTRDTVAALLADPRAGWRGVLNLADAWAPPRASRSGWAQGLDQRDTWSHAGR